MNLNNEMWELDRASSLCIKHEQIMIRFKVIIFYKEREGEGREKEKIDILYTMILIGLTLGGGKQTF